MTKHNNLLLSLLLVFSPCLINGAPTKAPILSPADGALPAYHCNDAPAWVGPTFTPKHCATAMAQFFVQKLLVHGDVVFEFQAASARSGPRYPPQKTPQKFTYGELTRVSVRYLHSRRTMMCIVEETADVKRSLTGTCTMAIVMLAAFDPEELPGVPLGRSFSLKDVASYSDVWDAARQVKDNCISRYLATNETMHESGGGLNFTSLTGWSAIGR